MNDSYCEYCLVVWTMLHQNHEDFSDDGNLDFFILVTDLLLFFCFVSCVKRTAQRHE